MLKWSVYVQLTLEQLATWLGMMYERGEWFQNQTFMNGIYKTGVRCIPKMINLASFPGFSLTFWSPIVQ